MSRGPYPILLMLAMSLPGAARALGLGEIRVDSALNEPLSAQIDIVGATRDDLIALTAKVANRESFQRFGAERPSFLSSATFKVGIDAQGRPVLNIRSVEAFTDPVINFLVELRWANGALVRDYSLLLDPAGFSPASRALAAANATAGARMTEAASTTTTVTAEGAAPVAAKPVTRPVTAAGQAQAGDGYQHRVAGRDTLRAIARRAGARSETQAQRMMIAIFRANPHAFDGNINRLHNGALLQIPSAAEAQAVDTAEAKHEYRAHMTSWRLDGRPAVQRRLAANPVTSQPITDAIPATQPKPAATGVPAVDARVGSAKEALTGRVHSLEKELDDMHRQLDQLTTRAAALSAAAAQAPASQQPVGAPVSREPVHAQPSREPSGSMLATAAAAELPVAQPIRVEVMRASTPQAAAGAASAAPAPAPSGNSRFMLLGVLAGALTLLLGGAAFVRRRLSNGRSLPPQIPAVEDYGRTLNVEPTPCPPAPQAPVYPEAPAVARATATAKLIAPEPVANAADIMEHAGSEQTTQSLAIDVEALERSYLDMGVDSFGIDSVVEDTAAHDTTALDPAMIETVVLDRSQAATAVGDAAPQAGASGASGASGAPGAPGAAADLGAAAADGVVLDYNLLDLDATVQHVHMPSKLNDHVVVTERRTNIVDVLKAAIDRDPHRRDLRMKLLETYYGTAAANQRAFLEVVRKASHERDFLSIDDWQKVMMMGREIAAGDAMFTDHPKEGELADCA